MLTIQQIKDTVTDYFKDKPVKKVYLFGSYARGEAREDSDIDLLVEYDDTNRRLSFFQVLMFKAGLESLLHKEVSLSEDENIHKGIKRYVERDKMLIFSS